MEAIVTLLIPVTFVALFAAERLFPARALPTVKGWTLKGILFFVVAMGLSGLIPALVAMMVGDWSPAGLRSLDPFCGGVIAFLVSDLIGYVFHRSFHKVNALWRIHQLHHSAERLDVPGAAYTHPLEILLPGIVTTVAVVALGVSPDAAAVAGFWSVFCAIFQHTNIRTPRWIGYLIQRPESHSIHHARGVHAYNYANLPLIDLVFGTFRNPESFSPVQGFWDGASKELTSLLMGRDVAETPEYETQATAGVVLSS